MLGLLDSIGFPPHPIGVGLILVCSVLWGLRGRLRGRPYLLALQAAIAAGLLARIGIALQSGSFSFNFLLSDIAALTIGHFVMFWFFCWLIISLIFTIRKRNDSTNIFTRSRHK